MWANTNASWGSFLSVMAAPCCLVASDRKQSLVGFVHVRRTIPVLPAEAPSGFNASAPAQWANSLTVPNRRSSPVLMSFGFPSPCATVSLWLPASGLACPSVPAAPQYSLPAAPCGPQASDRNEQQTPSLCTSLTAFVSLGFCVAPGRRKLSFHTKRLDGATEQGGDRGGRQKPGEGSFQGKTSKEEGGESGEYCASFYQGFAKGPCFGSWVWI